MDVKKILVPYDFSETSEAALRFAGMLAGDNDALLVILHVMRPFDPYQLDKRFGVDHRYPDSDTLRRALGKIIPLASAVAYQHQLVIGDPCELILEVAASERADLIVMGTHGRTGLSRALTGSVAESVLRNSPRPVITVKHPPQQRATQDEAKHQLDKLPGLFASES